MNPSDPTSSPSSTDLTQGASSPGDVSQSGTTAKAKRAAGKALGTAKEKVSSLATDQKSAAAGRISGYSDRLRATAESAAEQDPNIAHFANQAADRLQRAADYVRDSDFSRLRQDAADIAHRHPALFMGGMFAAGIVLGNLARASVQTIREDGSSGYGAHDYSDGDTDHYSDEATDESGLGAGGGVSDSFDAAPEQGEPRY